MDMYYVQFEGTFQAGSLDYDGTATGTFTAPSFKESIIGGKILVGVTF